MSLAAAEGFEGAVEIGLEAEGGGGVAGDLFVVVGFHAEEAEVGESAEEDGLEDGVAG